MIIIDEEVLKQLKNMVESFVSVHQGLKDTDLMMKVLEECPQGFYRRDIERAISEAVQENLIMRIEYQVRGNHTFHAFYLPSGSKTF